MTKNLQLILRLRRDRDYYIGCVERSNLRIQSLTDKLSKDEARELFLIDNPNRLESSKRLGLVSGFSKPKIRRVQREHI